MTRLRKSWPKGIMFSTAGSSEQNFFLTVKCISVTMHSKISAQKLKKKKILYIE